MKTKELNYELPPDLIAQEPAERRSGSRLLVLGRSNGGLVDSQFSKIGDFLRSGDCLVLNDTKVLPARFYGQRESGGKLEGLFLREGEEGGWEVMLKGGGKLKTGERFRLNRSSGENFCLAEMLGRTKGDRFELRIDSDDGVETILEEIGFAPLPPYIKRDRDLDRAMKDKQRYQTVYARQAGAVAAPTAGLHFSENLIEQLEESGICFAYITLHVGYGTFKPIKAENLEEHKMHEERFSVDEENARKINNVKERGGRIIAVGTTSVRTLETVVDNGRVEATNGKSELFIKPGYEFKMVDAMVTNFHLPRSSLLALVTAFVGLENILAAYKHAVEQRYRFYSYGDAMLIV